jgi:ankyrin repeat protein
MLRWFLLILGLVACGGCGGGSLTAAVGKGDTMRVIKILQRRPERVNEVDKGIGWTPLYMAVQQNNPQMVRLLLQYRPDLAWTSMVGETPLHVAAGRGRIDIVQQLVNKGAPLEVRDKKGQTPLVSALRGGAKRVAMVLINRGADVKASTADGMTPLHQAALIGAPEVAKLLLKRGAKLGVTTGNGETPLHLAARFGQLSMVQLLLQHRAAVNARDGKRRTPLHDAASGSIRFLTIPRPGGRPPSRIPHFVGSSKVAALLLRRGAAVDARDRHEWTPLHMAAWHGYRDVVRALLEGGADPNAADEGGETPLHKAARGYAFTLDRFSQHVCNPDVVRLLVERGARQVKNSKGRTPLQAVTPTCEKNGLAQKMRQTRPLVDVDGLQRSCDGGKLADCVTLGETFQVGKKVVRDISRATGLYRKACDGGSAQACNRLGVVSKDPAEKLALYRKSCDGGHGWGCFNLAICYQDGKGVARDKRRAAALYRKACDARIHDACNQLGVMMYIGDGIPKHLAGTVPLFDKACEGKVAAGCRNLGVVYKEGNAVARDLTRARSLFRKACSMGHKKACSEARSTSTRAASPASATRRPTPAARRPTPAARRPARTPPPAGNCGVHLSFLRMKYTVTVQQKAHKGKAVDSARTVAVRRSVLLGILDRLQVADHPRLARAVKRLVQRVKKAPRVNLFGGADARLSPSLHRALRQTMRQVAETYHCK